MASIIMQKRYWLAAVISFLGLCYLPPNASAQDRPAGQDEIKGARQVFSASFAAMGGERALEAIRSIKALADCVGPKGPYTTEIHSARRDRLKFRQASPDGSSFLGLVNGRHAWTIETQSGDVTPLGKSTAAMLRGHEFQMIAIAPQERFQRPRVEGYEDFAGSRAIKLSATDELGAPASLFFRADSNLLSGMVIVDPRSDGNEPVRIVYREWRQIGGVKLPSKITATDRNGEFALNFHRITLNDVSERLFEVPPPIASVAELLRLHERQREAHLKKDAEMLVAMFADDFVSISAGKIG